MHDLCKHLQIFVNMTCKHLEIFINVTALLVSENTFFVLLERGPSQSKMQKQELYNLYSNNIVTLYLLEMFQVKKQSIKINKVINEVDKTRS